MSKGPTGYKLKTTGKVNEWNVLTQTFVIGTPLDDIGITTSSETLTNELIEAMKNRDKVSITVGEAGDD